MRFMIHALACLAIAIPVGLGGGGEPGEEDDGPLCRASLEGDQLTTAIEFADGYTVEGPWTVVLAEQDAEARQMLTAVLDRIVEVRGESGDRVESPFPTPIETTFEGRDDAEVVQRAAEVWCVVVMKAQGHIPAVPGTMGPAPRVASRPARAAHG
jgi:hypothetical protein